MSRTDPTRDEVRRAVARAHATGNPPTAAQLARDLGVSRQRVHQIEKELGYQRVRRGRGVRKLLTKDRRAR